MDQVCEICGVKHDTIITIINSYDNSEKQIRVRVVRDHDHKTGFIRGLLCDPCNGRLGTYEARQISPRKNKGRYLVWLNKHKNEIKLYLAKEPSGEVYKGR